MPVYKSTPTSDGRQWYFRSYKKNFDGKNIQFKSKKYSTKKEAERQENLFNLNEKDTNHTSFIIIADDWFNEIKETKRTSTYMSYLYGYNKHIYPYFSKINIENIEVRDIEKWKKDLESQKYNVVYLNKLYDILNNIFKQAMKKYNLKSNVVELSGRFKKKYDDTIIKDKDKLKYITLEEFNKLLSTVDDITWRTFFIVLFYTGMRKGEIQALKVDDIDFNNNEIIVDKTLSADSYGCKITKTKNTVNRKIKMNKILSNQLKYYLSYLKSTYSDYTKQWFLFGCTHYLPRATIDRHKHYYFEKSGVREITIHQFRHSHVSLLINEYIKSGQTDTTKFFLMLSNRMGHTIPVMQKTYMHLFPTIQNDIVELLDNLNN